MGEASDGVKLADQSPVVRGCPALAAARPLDVAAVRTIGYISATRPTCEHKMAKPSGAGRAGDLRAVVEGACNDDLSHHQWAQRLSHREAD